MDGPLTKKEEQYHHQLHVIDQGGLSLGNLRDDYIVLHWRYLRYGTEAEPKITAGGSNGEVK